MLVMQGKILVSHQFLRSSASSGNRTSAN